MYCRYCGTKLEDSVDVCPVCKLGVNGPSEKKDDAQDATVVISDVTEVVEDATELIDTVTETASMQEEEKEYDPIEEMGQKIMENIEDNLILDPVHTDSSLGQRDTMEWNAEERGIYRKKEPTYDPEKEKERIARLNKQREEKEAAERAERKKKQTRFAIIFGIVGVTAAIVIAAVFITMNSPVKRLERAVSGRRFITAGEIYRSDFVGQEREAKGNAILEKAVAAILKDYQSDSMTAEKAQGYLDSIQEFWNDPDVENAKEEIMLLQASKKVFEDGMACIDMEDYQGAINNLKLVSRKDSNYDAAQKSLEDAKQKYVQQVLAQAESLEKKNAYDDAIAVLDEGFEFLGGNEELAKQRNQLVENKKTFAVENAKTNATRYEQQRNYFAAMQEMKAVKDVYPENTELNTEYNRYHGLYRDGVLADAESALGSETDPNYDAAILVLDTAINTIGAEYPELDTVFRDKKAEYLDGKNHTPALTVVGTWNVSSVKMGFMPVTPGIYKFVSGKSGELMQLEIYGNATYYMELLDIAETGSWSNGKTNSDGSCVVTLNNGNEMRQVTLTAGGQLVMTFQGEEFTFDKDES